MNMVRPESSPDDDVMVDLGYRPATPEDVTRGGVARRERRNDALALVRVRVERLTYTDDMALPVSITLLQEVLIEECVRGDERDPVHGDYRILVGQPAVDGRPPPPFRNPDHPRPGEVSRRGFLGRFRRSRGPLHLVFDCLQAVLPFGSRR